MSQPQRDLLFPLSHVGDEVASPARVAKQRVATLANIRSRLIVWDFFGSLKLIQAALYIFSLVHGGLFVSIIFLTDMHVNNKCWGEGLGFFSIWDL